MFSVKILQPQRRSLAKKQLTFVGGRVEKDMAVEGRNTLKRSHDAREYGMWKRIHDGGNINDFMVARFTKYKKGDPSAWGKATATIHTSSREVFARETNAKMVWGSFKPKKETTKPAIEDFAHHKDILVIGFEPVGKEKRYIAPVRKLKGGKRHILRRTVSRGVSNNISRSLSGGLSSSRSSSKVFGKSPISISRRLSRSVVSRSTSRSVARSTSRSVTRSTSRSTARRGSGRSSASIAPTISQSQSDLNTTTNNNNDREKVVQVLTTGVWIIKAVGPNVFEATMVNRAEDTGNIPKVSERSEQTELTTSHQFSSERTSERVKPRGYKIEFCALRC